MTELKHTSDLLQWTLCTCGAAHVVEHCRCTLLLAWRACAHDWTAQRMRAVRQCHLSAASPGLQLHVCAGELQVVANN